MSLAIHALNRKDIEKWQQQGEEFVLFASWTEIEKFNFTFLFLSHSELSLASLPSNTRGFYALKTVLIFLGKELAADIDSWPHSISKEQLAAFDSFLGAESKKVFPGRKGYCHEGIDYPLTHFIFSIGFFHLKNLMGKWHESYRTKILKMENLTAMTLLRDMLEINPCIQLEKIPACSYQIALVANLLNERKCDAGAVETAIRFIRSLIISPRCTDTRFRELTEPRFLTFGNLLTPSQSTSTNPGCIPKCEVHSPYPIDPADELFVFTYSILFHFFENKRISFMYSYIENLLEECASDAGLAYLKIFLENVKSHVILIEKHRFAQFPHLTYLLNIVQESLTDYASIEKIICKIIAFTELYRDDDRPKENLIFMRLSWINCKDLIFGFNVTMLQLDEYQKGAALLDEMREGQTLVRHKEGHELLVKTLFKKRNYCRKQLAWVIYKTWWYSRYMHGSPQALADRLVDWVVHDLLVHKENWTLEYEAVKAIAEREIRENYPYLPFNAIRVSGIYFSFKAKHARQSAHHSITT